MVAGFSDCACDWQMGSKKKRSAQPVKPVARRRDSEDDESEISAMSGTSDDKQRLAQTRAELREAGQEALRMAASHQTPIGNIFDPRALGRSEVPL